MILFFSTLAFDSSVAYCLRVAACFSLRLILAGTILGPRGCRSCSDWETRVLGKLLMLIDLSYRCPWTVLSE